MDCAVGLLLNGVVGELYAILRTQFKFEIIGAERNSGAFEDVEVKGAVSHSVVVTDVL